MSMSNDLLPEDVQKLQAFANDAEEAATKANTLAANAASQAAEAKRLQANAVLADNFALIQNTVTASATATKDAAKAANEAAFQAAFAEATLVKATSLLAVRSPQFAPVSDAKTYLASLQATRDNAEQAVTVAATVLEAAEQAKSDTMKAADAAQATAAEAPGDATEAQAAKDAADAVQKAETARAAAQRTKETADHALTDANTALLQAEPIVAATRALATMKAAADTALAAAKRAADSISAIPSKCSPVSPWKGRYTFVLIGITIAIGVTALLVPLTPALFRKLDVQQVPGSDFSVARFVTWLIVLLLLGSFTVCAGKFVTGMWRGLFIDSRNQISLSRMQMALWTILILSAWIAAALSNYSVGVPARAAVAPPADSVAQHISPPAGEPGTLITLSGTGFGTSAQNQKVTLNGKPIPDANVKSWSSDRITFTLPSRAPDSTTDYLPNQQVVIDATPDTKGTSKSNFIVTTPAAGSERSAIDVAIPVEIWTALGISIVSLIGSPLILNRKKDQTPDPTERQATVDQLGKESVKGAQNDVPPDGLLITKNCPEQSQFSDMFRGEETGNGAHLDLAKVQMFFFTVALVLAYSVSIGALFLTKQRQFIESLPPISAGFIALLGISHAGYLTNKAITHSKTDDGTGTLSTQNSAPPIAPKS